MAGALSGVNWGGVLGALGAGLQAAGSPAQMRPGILQQYQQQQQQQLLNRRYEEQLNMQIAENARRMERERQEQEAQAKQQGYIDTAIGQLPPELQGIARADPSIIGQYATQQYFPKPEAKPSGVQEYEYARSQGYQGSILDFQKEKAAAGRAPAQPRQPGIITLYDQNGAPKSFFDTDPQIPSLLQQGWIDDKPGSNGITITNPDGTVTQIGGTAKSMSAADQSTNLRSGMLRDAISEFDTIDFNKVRTPMIVAAEKTTDSPVMGALVQTRLNEDEKKLLGNQGKIQEAVISAITGAAYSEEQKQNMRAAYVPLATDDVPTRTRKLKDAAKFLRDLNSGINKTTAPQAPQAETEIVIVRDPATGKLIRKTP